MLMAVLTLRELNMTQAGTVIVSSQQNMKEEATTAGVSNTGVKSAKPVENVSLLQRLSGCFNAA
ncbi:MAG: hypothetical protein ACR5LD_11585 [Symbiopectobacterium sp.]